MADQAEKPILLGTITLGTSTEIFKMSVESLSSLNAITR